MFEAMPIALACLALVIEALFGYPDRLLRAVGHPVTWIGRLIGALDRSMNRDTMRPAGRRAAGIACVFIVIGVAGAVAYGLEASLAVLPAGTLFVALLASTLIAQRSLYDHVAAVAAALDQNLAAGREAVSHIVGRDPDALDEAGVARAAIESLAENFSDGVVAPAFWLASAGLFGGATYKAINTADSMIGHRTERHGAFGFAAARLDDIVNLPASRLAALLLVAAASLPDISRMRSRWGTNVIARRPPGLAFGEPDDRLRRRSNPEATAPTLPPLTRRFAALAMTVNDSSGWPYSWRGAWRAVIRDAPRHRSPNAGYPEAAMAGALGLALAGPRVYGGVMVKDALMGNGRREATAADIRAALALYRRADALLIGLTAALTVVLTAASR
jgi:adenosylcobinamide-phosphate synthase